jgi:crotonobetainyl-CoA:carnitine CoA-transferase CaiB-like acyl-CoA transferase
MTTSDSPLHGVRVLDLSRVLAGPYVGRMLADLGADVVKVEPPEGDVTRRWGKEIAGLSGYYVQQNVGKRDICVDLRKQGAPALIRKLAARADVLIENFRPGVMAQFGLSYPELARDNPRLIMLSISGFGQTGPESQRPAYAAVLHAESGIVARQATIDGTRPVDPHVSVADMNVALHGLSALLAALFMRDRAGSQAAGRGQHIDIGMLDAMMATDDYTHMALDGVPEPHGIVNHVWEVVGGHIVIAGDFRWVWQRLNEACGVADPTPKGASLEEKIRHRHEAVASYLGSFTDRAALYAALNHADLAWGEVRSSAQAVQSPTLAARESLTPVEDGAGGTRRVVRSPYRFSAAISGIRGRAPYRGEHNREVLTQWLSLSEAEIARLAADGVLLAEPLPATLA